MTIRATELLLVSIIVALVASVATVVAWRVWDTAAAAAIPWGVLAGALAGVLIATIQHVTGATYLDTTEEGP